MAGRSRGNGRGAAGGPIQTIYVTTGRMRPTSRLSRLRVRYPDPDPSPRYDAGLARELLIRTGELPASKRGLLLVLIEYRRALVALVTEAAQQTGASRSSA